MYIDTLESVMSQSSKVMIDVEGGNNMMYLPLDRMVQRQNDVGVGGRSILRLSVHLVTRPLHPQEPVAIASNDQ